MYDAKRFADYRARRKANAAEREQKTYLLHDEAGYSALAAAILYQAMKDLERVRSSQINTDQEWISRAMGFSPVQDLDEYCHSGCFEIHCHLLGIPPDQVRINLDIEPAN